MPRVAFLGLSAMGALRERLSHTVPGLADG